MWPVRCPFCSFESTKVVDSRLAEPGDAVRRRRECAGCGERFTTYERAEGPVVSVQKRDGRSEPLRPPEAPSRPDRAAGKRPVSERAAGGAGGVDRLRGPPRRARPCGRTRSATWPSADSPGSTPWRPSSSPRSTATSPTSTSSRRWSAASSRSPSRAPANWPSKEAPRGLPKALRSVRSGEQHRSFPPKAAGHTKRDEENPCLTVVTPPHRASPQAARASPFRGASPTPTPTPSTRSSGRFATP